MEKSSSDEIEKRNAYRRGELMVEAQEYLKMRLREIPDHLTLIK